MLPVGDSTNTGNNYIPPTNTTNPTTTTSDTGEVARTDSFSQVGSIVGTAAAGAASSWKFSAQLSESLKNTISATKAADGFGGKTKAAMPGVKQMGLTTLKAGGVGAIITGAVSAITNGIEVMQGKKTGAEAIGTFAADTVNGTVGAMSGAALGAGAYMGLSALIPSIGATPLLVATAGVGLLGAVLADKLFKGSGAYDAIRSSVIGSTSQK